MKPYFETKLGELYCSDILTFDILSESVDLIVTDVPYGVGYKNIKWDTPELVISAYWDWLKIMYDALKDGSHCYIFIPTLHADTWISGVKEAGFTFKNLLSVSVYPIQHHRFTNNFIYDNQLIIFAHKGKGRELNKVEWVRTSESWLNDKRNPKPHEWSYRYPAFIRRDLGRGNIKANAKTKMLHPNQKSDELIGKFIELSSDEGDVVADFFCGSGSTLVAAESLGRRWLGCDIDENYCKITKQRLKGR